jgi:hypothetical protein
MSTRTKFVLLAAAATAALATTLTPAASADTPVRELDKIKDDGRYHVAERIPVPAHKSLWIDLNKVTDTGTRVDVCAEPGRCLTLTAESGPAKLFSAGNRPKSVTVSMRAEDWGPGEWTHVTWTHWTS